ncbi:DUF2069 domain-containing protein [Mangrovitalea sediminis]|uniref:DUF2069 domain-containing protein n=1 Tax=Mangrovitalea sediminis TaxID=1982043 RepID=UPI000BE5B8B9|nr:DUF2069 domain-containing protein [Mangrovitalea sediminis]
MLHTAKARVTRVLTVLVYALLLAWLVLTTFWPAPVAGASAGSLLAVKLIPLLIFLPGVWRGQNRTLIWMSFVLLFYFLAGFMSAWVHHGHWRDSMVAAMSALLFVLSLCHIRLNRQ